MSKALSFIGAAWCRMAHREISWPVCGEYVCLNCLRRFRVRWGAR